MASPIDPLNGQTELASGLNSLSNQTTLALERDEDEISLTSTAESEPQDEYEVETIHAQDIREGRKVYLVKWKGYENLRCTWEPRDSFNTREILHEWKNKRRQIRRGTRQPFDVEAWEAEVEVFENAREDRKRRRRAKRARLGLLRPDDQESTTLSPAGAPTSEAVLTAPPASLDTSSDDETPLMNKRSVEQTKSSNTSNVPSKSPSLPQNTSDTSSDDERPFLNQRRVGQTSSSTLSIPSKSPSLSQNTPTSIQPKPGKPPTVQPAATNPTTQTASRSKKPEAVPPKPVDIKLVEGRVERNDLTRVLNSARQKPNLPTEKTKPWKLFRTTYRFEKASQQDPEPNREDLELQTPKTWSPFQMSSFLRKRQEKEDNSLFVEQDEVPETQQTSPPPAVSIQSPKLQSQLNAAQTASTLASPVVPQNDHTHEVRGSPSTESSDYIIIPREQPPFGSKGWKPLMIGSRQLRRKGDMLCRLSYGADAVEIGDVLLCDTATDARSMIYKLRYEGQIRVRFEEICSLDRFQSLAAESSKEVSSHGFILAYSDTELELFRLGDLLGEKDLVAIARICPYPYDSVRGLTLVCYPTQPRSKSFQLLNQPNFTSPPGSLRFAVINEVLPRQLRQIVPENSLTRRLPERPERQGRYEGSGKAAEKGLAPWRFPSQSNPSAAGPDDSLSPTMEQQGWHRDSRFEISNLRKQQAPEAPQITHSNVLSKAITTVADEPTEDALSVAMDMSSEIGEDVDMSTGGQAPVTNDANGPSPTTPKLSGQYTDQAIPETQDVQMVDVDNAENIDLKEYLTSAFLANYKITYDEIAAVTIRASIKVANCFYLWFPEEADGDFQVLEKFLDQHYAIVLSNRKQNDWEKFTKSSSGVALFHHSFLQFSDMPGFHKLTMSSSFNFWNVSLQRAIPNIEPPTHFQRIFPQGTGYLMTEDFMIHERDAAIMVLAWFRDTALSKLPGTLKMMVRPNVLEWLDRMSKEDVRFSIMAILIGHIACHGEPSDWPVEARDLDCFYNSSLESPIISLSELPNVGAAADTNAVSKGGDQLKDTDLLCEVFAAWAILNAASLRKFLILTHNKPMDRWQKWQHIVIIQGVTDFFRKSNINKDHYSKWLAQSVGASSSSSSSSANSATPALPAQSTLGSAKLPSRRPPPPLIK